MSDSIEIKKARKLLKEAFPSTEKAIVYMAVYKNSNGREIALQRERSIAFFVWLERYDTSIEGVSIKNDKNPGLPYERVQARSASLNDTTAPRLKKGNKVWYLQVDDLTALKSVIDWYGSV
jgi:hypothetical protein